MLVNKRHFDEARRAIQSQRLLQRTVICLALCSPRTLAFEGPKPSSRLLNMPWRCNVSAREVGQVVDENARIARTRQTRLQRHLDAIVLTYSWACRGIPLFALPGCVELDGVKSATASPVLLPRPRPRPRGTPAERFPCTANWNRYPQKPTLPFVKGQKLNGPTCRLCSANSV